MRLESDHRGNAGRPAPGRMHCEAISLAGQIFIPHISGALWWPAQETLLVADLHFEKGSAHAARGAMLPPYDTTTTLSLLEAVIETFSPRRIVALGDSFHDDGAGERISSEDLQRLLLLQSAGEWLWVAGNHDPRPPERIGGVWHTQIRLGPLVLQHQPSPEGVAEISGHLHPVAKVRARGRLLRRRCFVTDGRRLVLPAFGAFTGGLNVLDKAFAGLFNGRGFQAWMLGARTVHAVAGRSLVA